MATKESRPYELPQEKQHRGSHCGQEESIQSVHTPPNESRFSCGALKKDSFHNLRAPPASSAC